MNIIASLRVLSEVAKRYNALERGRVKSVKGKMNVITCKGWRTRMDKTVGRTCQRNDSKNAHSDSRELQRKRIEGVCQKGEP